MPTEPFLLLSAGVEAAIAATADLRVPRGVERSVPRVVAAGDRPSTPGLDGLILALVMRRLAGDSTLVVSFKPVTFIVVVAFAVPLDEFPLFDLCYRKEFMHQKWYKLLLFCVH